MTFSEACVEYQEPNSVGSIGHGGMGLVPNPPVNSNHNTLLFSSVKAMLLEIFGHYSDYEWLLTVVFDREIELGLYSRLIGTTDLVAHDDLIGIASVDREFAEDIWDYGEIHNWTWGDRKLWRMPIFIPAIKLGMGAKLNILNHLMLAGCYIANIFENKKETSGKQLLWLVSQNTNAWYVKLWRMVMNRKYPDGVKGMFTIYYGLEHPFTRYTNFKF